MSDWVALCEKALMQARQEGYGDGYESAMHDVHFLWDEHGLEAVKEMLAERFDVSELDE